MKPQPEPGNWREAVWRKRLDPSTVAALRQSGQISPEDLAELEGEWALNQLLERLPPPPRVSNLAARVLAEIAVADSSERRMRSRTGFSAVGAAVSRWLHGSGSGRRSPWAGGVALTLAVLLGGLGLSNQWNLRQRGMMARDVAEVTRATAVPGVAVLRDFDAIAALKAGVQPHPTDVDLMAALAQ